jgi:hypothetical protein
VGLVTRMREFRNAYEILVENRKGKRPLDTHWDRRLGGPPEPVWTQR